jgi:hypothetical protein
MFLLHKFPHIKRTKSQIIFHIKYTNTKSPQVCIRNTNIGSSTQNGCNFYNIKEIHNIKKIINSKKDTCESKHVNTYR